MQQRKNSTFKIIRMIPDNTNSVLVSSDDKCVIFDAWGHANNWIKLLQERKLIPQAIYATHGHPDHISAAPALSEHYNIPWYLHSGDFRLVGWGNDLLEHFELPKINLDCNHPTALEIKRTEILPDTFMEIIETPGHTPGGVSYHFSNDKLLLIGDTIFQDSVGRYDLPGGDKKMLSQSITHIYNKNLPRDTTVIHGHGVPTNIDWLNKNNPFFK